MEIGTQVSEKGAQELGPPWMESEGDHPIPIECKGVKGTEGIHRNMRVQRTWKLRPLLTESMADITG